jgi:hypothetical protein
MKLSVKWEKHAMERPPHLPRRRSPALNALVVGAIVLFFVVAGVVIWNSWTRGSVTAIEEAHEAEVQPVETLIAPTSAQPARPANQGQARRQDVE